MHDVIVIGGGSTGTGVARDLSMRGLSVTLVERGDLASGTTGRCHGVLHSGARYVVTDPEAARACARESAVLKRILAPLVEDTGGLYASLAHGEYIKSFVRGCSSCGIAAEELTPQEACAREPSLHPDIAQAVQVSDASCDPFMATVLTARDAEMHGADLHTYTTVVGVIAEGATVTGVRVSDGTNVWDLRADAVVNATGPWASSLARELRWTLVKGAHVVAGERLVNGLIHHLRPPTEGDILVPLRASTILGTTSVPVAAPLHAVTEAEVRQLVAECAALVPAVRHARLLRAYAGTRVLFGDTRQFALFNEWENFFTVAGGKWTTHRLIAEMVSDAVCHYLGVRARCRTAVEPVVEGDVYVDRGQPFLRAGAGTDAALACTCEAVPSSRVAYAIDVLHARTIDDVMRRTRAGFGPCQGSWCGPHIAAALAARSSDPGAAQEDLCASLRRRSRGVLPILGLSDVQLRQELLKRHFYGLYGTYADTGTYDGRWGF